MLVTMSGECTISTGSNSYNYLVYLNRDTFNMPFIETDNHNHNSRVSTVYLREYHMETAINKDTE